MLEEIHFTFIGFDKKFVVTSYSRAYLKQITDYYLSIELMFFETKGLGCCVK